MTEAFRGNVTPAHEIAISVVPEHPAASTVKMSCLPASSTGATLSLNTKATKKWFCARVKRQTNPCHKDCDVLLFAPMPAEHKVLGESRLAPVPQPVSKTRQHPPHLVMGLTMLFVIRAEIQNPKEDMQVK